ncbi:NUDIX hydrolase [Jatrophihabitans sp. DSM 45814]
MTAVSNHPVYELIASIQTLDDLAREHKAQALRWLNQTGDIYRRVKPHLPSPHLVAYFLVVDRQSGRVLLCDHRLSGLWLPTGGHVERGEDPVDTVRREAMEELGIEAQFEVGYGPRPFFLTMTDTVGQPEERHTDVSLWFALSGSPELPIKSDDREFFGVRWWSRAELLAADSARFEPHLLRALDALASIVSRYRSGPS